MCVWHLCEDTLESKYKKIISLSHRLSDLIGESALSIQSSEKVTSISLPLTPPYHTLEFLLDVLCHIPSCLARMESGRLTNGQINHHSRSRTRFNSGMAIVDQKV